MLRAVNDIREQFSLLPISSIQDVACNGALRNDDGFRHRCQRGCWFDAGISRTVKYTDELSSGKRLLRTLEKLELEGVWWLQPGVVSAIQARVSQRLRCASDGSKYESHICRLLPGIGCDIWHL